MNGPAFAAFRSFYVVGLQRFFMGGTLRELKMKKSITAFAAAIGLFALGVASAEAAGQGGNPPGWQGGSAPPGFTQAEGNTGWVKGGDDQQPPGWNSPGNPKGWNGAQQPPGFEGRPASP